MKTSKDGRIIVPSVEIAAAYQNEKEVSGGER